jgi:hypothetical protein
MVEGEHGPHPFSSAAYPLARRLSAAVALGSLMVGILM